MSTSRSTNSPRRYQRGPHIKRRGKIWYAFGVPGVSKDGRSLKTTDATEANRLFRDILANGKRDELGRSSGAREETLKEIVAAWLKAPIGYTRRTLESHAERVTAVMKWLSDNCGVAYASEITDGAIDDWITARAEKVSRRTINRDLRSLRVCLRWAASRERCTMPKAIEREGLREAQREAHRYLPDPTEVRRVVDLVPRAGYRDALTLLYATGLRHEELMRLKMEDVRDGKVWVQPEQGPAVEAEPTKGYRARAIPVADAVREVAVRFLAWRNPEVRGRSAAKNALHAVLAKACDATKVPRFGLHDLRRAFATEAVRAGIPLTVVRDWLGHRLTATTERYVGRYRTDAAMVAPVPAALAGIADAPTELPG